MVRCRNVGADYAQRFEDGDYCIAAVADEKIVGFEWFCTNPRSIKSPYGYELETSPDAVYAYDAFLLPEYRMRGFWLRFKSALSDAMDAWGKNRIVTYVDYGNWVSLKTHLRFGFKITKRVLIVQLFGWRLAREMSARIPKGIGVPPASLVIGQEP
jgi:GNAT superfamily N-acetyltransferase